MSTSVSAATVMKLRERTGAGMMECKKFLLATDGDIEQAILEMRKAGQAKADKKADRIAAEGVIALAKSDDGKSAVMIEINSETDFVSRDAHFTQFAAAVAETALSHKIDQLADVSAQKLMGSEFTVEETRQQLVAKLGENIHLRRMVHIDAASQIGFYLHGSRIGVMVALRRGTEALAKDIAMHIAASRPLVLTPQEVSVDAINQEKEIFAAQARDSGKPQAIIDKMIEGRISKFLDEVSLLGQSFVKDPSIKIAQLLEKNQAEISAFQRFEVGEGIEKKQDNFVEEVMAQVRDS